MVTKLDRLERLTDLLLVLLETKRPLTISEISHMVAGYPEGEEACREAFERDKRTLREEGIPISVEPVAAREQLGYRIHADQYYLSSLELSPEEQVALNIAVAGVHLGDSTATEALSKIGVDSLPSAGLVATIPDLPVLADLFDALRSQEPITFEYKGTQRNLVVEGLFFKRGHWYLAGWDRSRSGFRLFRADRLEGKVTPVASKKESSTIGSTSPDDYSTSTNIPTNIPTNSNWMGPADLSSNPSLGHPDALGDHDSEATPRIRRKKQLVELLDLAPWRAGDEELLLAKVLIDPSAVSWMRAELAPSVEFEEVSDGSVQLELEVTNRSAFRSWLFGFLSHAIVIEPPELVDFVVDWLKAMLRDNAMPVDYDDLRNVPMAVERPSMRNGDTGGGYLQQASFSEAKDDSPSPVLSKDAHESHSRRYKRSQRMKAGERLRRLLAILAYLARRGEASITELSRRFGMDSHELVQELELAACCGLPPYTPDQLIDLLVEGDKVTARLGEGFARRRRLNSREALALIASAKAIMAVPGADTDGALASALAKLERAVGSEGRLQVDLDEPVHLGSIRRAVSRGEKLEIEYYSASRDELRWRKIVPLAVVAIDGYWYCDAFCEHAAALRRFRVDRIVQVYSSGTEDEQLLEALRQRYGSDVVGHDRAFIPADDDLVVTLDVSEKARWVTEAYPVLGVESRGGGRLIISLPVGGRAWLERLLLRLGPDAKVLAPRDLVHVGTAVAERLLERYMELGGEN